MKQGGGNTFENALEAIQSISSLIAVPDEFMPLIGREPLASINFKQNGARGIIIYDDETFGRVVIGGSPKKPNGMQVVISGEYTVCYYTRNLQVDFYRSGERERVRGSVSGENFLYVRRTSTDYKKNPWGYAFWLAE